MHLPPLTISSGSLSNPRARQQEWLVLRTTCIYLFIIDLLFPGNCFAPNHIIVTLRALDYEYDNEEFYVNANG